MAENLKKILFVRRGPDGGIVSAEETERVYGVRGAMDRLASDGLAPQPGYDISRKLVYNWADDSGTEAFIL